MRSTGGGGCGGGVVGGERTESDRTGPEKRKTHMRLDPGTGLTLSMHVQRSVKRVVTPQHRVLITVSSASKICRGFAFLSTCFAYI